MKKSPWYAAAVASAAVMLAAPGAADASAPKVDVCHLSESRGAILSVGAPALDAHLEHGDYVTTLIVGQPPGQFPNGVYFDRIGSALDAARDGRLARGELVSTACRITVVVPAGTYYGSAIAPATGSIERFPLVVDVPDITLRGALEMEIDDSGRAKGSGTGDGETTLTPLEPLPVVDGSSTPLIVVNGHPDESAGNGFIVEGFVFQSGHDPDVDSGGQGVLAVRVTGVVVRRNRFEAGFSDSVDFRAASGALEQNHLSGTRACDVCLAGPGSYRAVGNRLLKGGLPGIVVAGFVDLPLPSVVEPLEVPVEAETWAEILNNEVRDHGRAPVGVGIRVDALGNGAPDVRNKVHAVIRDNLLVNNRFGMIVHAAFPVNDTARKGDVDVTLGGNVFEKSCQARLLVSLSRHTTALGLSGSPYLLDSTFQLDLGGDIEWDAVWYSHPDGFGNRLIVDGQLMPNGSRHFYDAAGCPSY